MTTSNDQTSQYSDLNDQDFRYCDQPVVTAPEFSADLAPDRLSAILALRTKWVNSTNLHYYFFDRETDGSTVTRPDGSTRFVSWVGGKDQQDVVRNAFVTWKNLGVGLEFHEVFDRSEAEIRIGFMPGDGSWSYLGREVLPQGMNSRTTNYGWDLTRPDGFSTALHEIGHLLGMSHEHQNPFAGIVWNEELVYQTLAGPPNEWPREKTFHNILRKLDPASVTGSVWDPESVMEYPFPPGLVREPVKYATEGIDPPGTISALDAQYVRQWYPPTEPVAPPTLTPFQSVPLNLKPGEQADFVISPTATRNYQIGTFGASDTVLVLFEKDGDQLRYVTADDDSGTSRNSLVTVKLFQGRTYVVRIRLYYSGVSGQTAVMYW